MKRCGWVWIMALLCAAVVFAAMSVVSRHVMRLEAESTQSRLRAEHAEKIRLALWRLESEANSIMLLENTRDTVGFLQLPKEGLADYVRGYFDMNSEGALRIMEQAAAVDEEKLRAIMKARPDETSIADNNGILGLCLANAWSVNVVAPEVKVPAQADSPQGQPQQQAQQLDLAVQQVAEKGKRQAVVNRSYNNLKTSNVEQQPWGSAAEETQLIAGNYRPVWLSGELFLVRRVLGAHGQSVQGVWLRTERMQQRLLGLIADLFHDATLEPVAASFRTLLHPQEQTQLSDSEPLSLVTLPWRLRVAEPMTPVSSGSSPAMTALRFAWFAVIVALIAAMVLMFGLLRLSERRATFVSSVTHELRTPLTTFQLYTDMLASGMVREEAKRRSYFETLRREADRLGHLVENVLAFARLERGSARGGMREISVAELLETSRERIAARLEQAGLTLRVICPESLDEVKLNTDLTAVEHVLMNLADNAAKYAHPTEPAEVVLAFHIDRNVVEISLRDFGPGIPAKERRKIFRAFHKSAQAAANSKPGVGLGLALSRRLVREMGATLRYRPPQGRGACFVLALPKSR